MPTTKTKLTVDRIPTEYLECKWFFEWTQTVRSIRDFVIHHVNEGKRSKIGGSMLCHIGLRKGLPDYQILLPNKNHFGLFIEMKRKNGQKIKKNPDQIKWLDRLNQAGYHATFAYGWQDASAIVNDYLANKI